MITGTFACSTLIWAAAQRRLRLCWAAPLSHSLPSNSTGDKQGSEGESSLNKAAPRSSRFAMMTSVPLPIAFDNCVLRYETRLPLSR
jgi:hypothetical protein